MTGHASNPFATRFIAPGRIAWVGAADDLDQLVVDWQQLNFRAAIVGPHGSGKSTLLEHFVPRVGQVTFRRDAVGNTADGSPPSDSGPSSMPGPPSSPGPSRTPSLPSPIDLGLKTSEGLDVAGPRTDRTREARPTVWLQLRRAEPRSMVIPWHELCRGRLLVVDGYEQLSPWRRAYLLVRTWQRGVALLLTSHRRTLLPTLREQSVSTDTARQIIARLMAAQGNSGQPSDEEIRRGLQRHAGNLRELLMDLYDRLEQRTPDRATES